MTHVTLTRKRELVWVSPEKIVANENNPRAEAAFKAEELVDLRRSIMTHGILEPVIVSPYKGDTYKLIEGERRWTSARIEGVKEIPAIVVNRMNDTEELVTMFNVHSNRRGWERAEELEAIKRLVADNPGRSDTEMAAELGMNQQTFKERRQVLAMGDDVLADIAQGKLDYYAALRCGQVSKTIANQRPELTLKLGGEPVVRDRLISKAKARGGVTRELENIRQDVRDKDAVPDDVLETYIERREASLTEARAQAQSLAERRGVEQLIKQILHLNSELRAFEVDLHAVPNLNDLRRGLVGLIDTAQRLEGRIVDVTITKVVAS